MEQQYTMKQARNLAGKTQTQIANELGVCLASYNKMEKHPERMTIAQAKLFCRAVGQPADAISFGLNSN